MSGTIIASILISLTPLFFPVLMQAFGLLTGLVQAYIFAVLAMVFIASALGDDASSTGLPPAHPAIDPPTASTE